MVRLKESANRNNGAGFQVSIPYGAIKRNNRMGNGVFNKTVSIPYGAIKSKRVCFKRIRIFCVSIPYGAIKSH